MKKQARIILNEKGIGLVMVLLILTVISILGLALMGLTLNNMKMSSVERTYQSTYYIAESGVTYTLNQVSNEIVDIYNSSTSKGDFFSKIDMVISDINNAPSYKEFEEAFGQKPEAKVLIEKIGNQHANNLDHQDYKITSNGIIDGRSRTVEKRIRISWKSKKNMEVPDSAVFVKEIIDLSGGAKIIGDVGTNSSAPSSVILDGGASITGTVYVGPNAGNDVIKKPQNMNVNFQVIKIPTIKTFDLPPFPNYPINQVPSDVRIHRNSNSYNVIDNGALRVDNWIADNYTLNLSRDLHFNQIYITSNNTLNIDIGNADRTLVVDHLNVPNGKIQIKGTGRLTLYVTNNITLGAGSIINTADEIVNKNVNEATKLKLLEEHIKKLDIFYRGNRLEMSGSQKIYGSLYAENADIIMTGGSGFQGHIITGGGKIDISGGANAMTQIFYAPDAEVEITGGGNITGNIISKRLTMTGGGSIIYEKVSADDLPPMFGGTTGTVTLDDIFSITEPTREK